MIPPELQVFALAMAPIGELRVAIPVALQVYHLSVPSSYVFSVLGALVPALFWLFSLEKIYKISQTRAPSLARALDFVFERTRNRYHGHVRKYGALALIPFVAVPLPFTGVWTASLASFLFRIPFRKAFPLIALGAAISGLIMVFLVQTGLSVHEVFGWQIFVALTLIALAFVLAWSRIRSGSTAFLDILVSVFVGIVLSYLVLVFLRTAGMSVGDILPHFSDPYLFIFLPALSMIFIILSGAVRYRSPTLHQVDKYLLIGVLNVAIDLLVLNSLILFFEVTSGLGFAAIKGLSYTAATVNSYFWSKNWIFPSEGPRFSMREYGMFYKFGFVGLLLNVASASLVVDVIHPQFGLTEQVWANVAGLSGALFSGSWRFLTSKFLVFNKK